MQDEDPKKDGFLAEPFGDASCQIAALEGRDTALFTWRSGKDTDLGAAQLRRLAGACLAAAAFLDVGHPLATPDYEYSVLDFGEWLDEHDPRDVSLREVFAAGEKCGADAQRGGIWMELVDLEYEAEEEGWSLCDLLRQSLKRQAEEDAQGGA